MIGWVKVLLEIVKSVGRDGTLLVLTVFKVRIRVVVLKGWLGKTTDVIRAGTIPGPWEAEEEARLVVPSAAGSKLLAGKDNLVRVETDASTELVDGPLGTFSVL
jgi:hypothetical protein